MTLETVRLCALCRELFEGNPYGQPEPCSVCGHRDTFGLALLLFKIGEAEFRLGDFLEHMCDGQLAWSEQ